jgi:hypothetical protein
LSAEDKPSPTAPPPSGTGSDGNGGDRDKSSPNLSEVDSAWNDEEEYDEDATMVAKVPLDLVALSRRGTELEKKPEPEKHDAITARPPPQPGAQPGEASVVIDAPHENLPRIETPSVEIRAADEDDEDEEHDDDDDLVADDLDAGWDIEEERAVAADVAAGLDADARRKAAEARAAQRKEKSRAKKLAAKEKRKARADSIRLKQKKPKKRSIPPPRDSLRPAAGKVRTPVPPKPAAAARATSPSREFPTIPPKDLHAAGPLASSSARRDMNRMVFIVAIIVVIGALVIGLSRR